MKQSALGIKTRREAPKDEAANNAKLLIRAGFIHKELAGVYAYLPLGLRVLEKINQIIRREMQAVGGVEVLLTSLQNPVLWQETGRWSDEAVDVWFKTKLKNESELGLGLTHEEPVTALMREHIKSYRDLPRAVYQIQTKFRNEVRAKSGLLRGREFLMKDLYSFHADATDLDAFYEKIQQAYRNIYNAVGIGAQTYLTFASGGMFSKYSHEFQTITTAGEDTIYVSEDKKLAVNKEVCTDEVLAELGVSKDELLPRQAIEVGNIFKLGTRFSTALGLNYTSQSGEQLPVVMGSYGLGPTRLLGTIAEVCSDEHGLVWPASVAPFTLHLIQLGQKGESGGGVAEVAGKLYDELTRAGVEVLWDDRDLTAGEQLADADLIGLPWRVVVSERGLAEGKFELKNRATGEIITCSHDELLKTLKTTK